MVSQHVGRPTSMAAAVSIRRSLVRAGRPVVAENTGWFVFAQVGARIKLVSTGFCGQKSKLDLKTQRLPLTEINSLFFSISG